MLNFQSYMDRHGEFGIQAILERIERNEGIRVAVAASLEDRWNAIMGNDNNAHQPVMHLAA